MEQDIQNIREACIAANPEIVELKFGCEIEKDNGEAIRKYKVWYYKQGEKMECISVDQNLGYSFVSPYEKNFTILGRPIRLADVLLAIRKDKWPGAEGHQVLLGRMTEADVCEKWNLRNDTLTEQSPETIEFISNLLTN